MEHLSEQDLEQFRKDLLEPAEIRRVVRHLVTGCTRCQASLLLAGPREVRFWQQEQPAEEEYDRALDQAWRKTRKLLPRILEDGRRRDLGVHLLRKVQGDWNGVTWPERRSFQGLWPHVEILLQRSFDCRYSDPRQMLYLAKTAQECADEMGAKAYPIGLRLDLRARAWGELGNAYRVNERYTEGEKAFGTANRLLAQGTGDPMIGAHLKFLEASLKRAQCSFPEAVELLDEVYQAYSEVGEDQLAAEALVKKGNCLRLAGRPLDAVKALEQAITELDPERDPKLVAIAQHTLIEILIEAGKFAGAGRMLFESGLWQRYADDPLNLLRLRWTEAKILAGRKRFADAERVFGDVRTGFRERELHYDAALAGLDLAVVLAKQKKDVWKLAWEIRVECENKGINPQAMCALVALETFGRFKVATPPRVERLRDFLYQVRESPTLRFEPLTAILG